MERHWLVLFLLVAIRLALAETDVTTDLPVSTEASEVGDPKITETADVSPSSESASPSNVGDDRPSIYLFKAPSSIKSAQKVKGPETSSEYALPWNLSHSTQQVTTSTSTEPPTSESLNWFQRRQQEQQRIQQQQKEQIQIQQEQQRIQQQQKEQVQIQQSQQEQQRIQVQQQHKEQQRIQVQQQQKEQQRIQEQQRVQVQQQEQQRVQVQQQEQQKIHVQQHQQEKIPQYQPQQEQQKVYPQQQEKIPQYEPQQEQQKIQIQQQQQEKIPQYQPQQVQQKVYPQQQEQQKVQVQPQQEQQKVSIQQPQEQEKYQPQQQTRFQFQQQQHRVQQQQQHRIQQQQRVQQQHRQPFEEGFSNIKQFKSSSIKTAPSQQVEQTEKIAETNNEVSPKGKVPFQSQPSEEDRLQKADQALDQYFSDVLANLSVKMKTGMDEPLGEILDPVRLDDMQLQPLVAGEVFDVRMKKISVGGLSDFRVTQLESQLSESRIKVGIHYPKISANCLFGANGTLYEIFKVTGRGNATIIFNEVHARTVLYLTKDNGVLQVTSADQPYVDFKSAEILFKDEEAADDVEPVKAESVATQLGPLYFWVLTANAVDKIDYPLAEYFNKALKDFPLSDFLDGHVFRQRHLRIHVPSHPIPYAYVASDLA